MISNYKESKPYSINEVLGWYQRGELDISPKYQRKSVWTSNAKSYLIDSIIRGFPIPPIFMRQSLDVRLRKTFKEIIDGQQRIRTIIGFLNDEFTISKSHNKDYCNFYFSDLSDEMQSNFLSYNISFELIKIESDSLIYEMFARLNTNNVALNEQEIRNARYSGEFKVFIYRKASQYREWFLDNKIFSDKAFTRMEDVQFFNYLVIHLLDGITTDTNKSIEEYYKKYDSSFENCEVVESKLDFLLGFIFKMFKHETISLTFFKKPNYFFTLYCSLNSYFFGIQGFSEANPNAVIEKSEKHEKQMVHILNKLNDYEAYLSDEEFAEHILKLHKVHTTNKGERTKRIEDLLESLF